MKLKIILLSFTTLFCLFSNAQETDSSYNKDQLILDSLINESKTYLKNRDLDGDNIADQISFNYTGGGHCCYKISIFLTSKNETIDYPFQMDGGYVFGVDGSQPKSFGIEDYDNDGLEEIFMEIETYNGEKYPIKKKWKRKYDIKTNHILFDFKGSMILKDFILE